MYLIMYLVMSPIMHLTDSQHLRLDRQLNETIRPVGIRRKPRRRRAVVRHRVPDRWDAGTAPFGQVQLFQELPNAAVTRAPGNDLVVVERLDPDPSVRTGVTDNLDPIRIDPELAPGCLAPFRTRCSYRRKAC
jgi:hypothetical protein